MQPLLGHPLEGIEPLGGIEAQPFPPMRVIFAERDEAGNPVRDENGEPVFGPRRCEIDEDCIEIRGDERVQRGECSFPERPELPERWCVQPRQDEPPQPPLDVVEPGEEQKLNECVSHQLSLESGPD